MPSYTDPTRRHVLRGMGAFIALPFLESLLPRGAKAATASPQRLVSYYTPCGYNMATFVPQNAGPNYTLSPCLMPLAAHKAQMLVLTGLNNEDQVNPDGRVGEHAIGTSLYGTCAHIPDGGNPLTAGKSGDQMVADGIGMTSRFKSMQMGVRSSQSYGDSGFPSTYTGTVSWASPSSPLPHVDQADKIFNALFSNPQASATASPEAAAAASARVSEKRSILDEVLSQITSVSAKVGKSDAAKLDQYLTSIRQVEGQLTNSMGNSCTMPAQAPAPTSLKEEFDAIAALTVLALQCDATRVISLMAGYGASGLTYTHLGITSSHHNLSHHGGNQDNLDKLTQIVTYEMSVLNQIADGLKAIPTATGTLLDDTLLVTSSEMDDPDTHRHGDMPVVVVGGLNLGIKGGNCINYPKGTDFASVWLTIANTFGVKTDKMGTRNTSALLTDWS